jgi:hypothetical protein
MGAVVVLRSTTELAEVQVPSSGDHCWVKVTDLTKLDEDTVARKSHARGLK